MFRKTLTLAAFFIALIASANAQTIEDALRFAQPNGYITPRAGGLNIAFHGISDDISALMYNPAGLSLITKSEISLGLDFTRNTSETDFLGNLTNFNSNDAYFTHLGLVAPFKAGDRNAAIAIAYFLESDFENNLKYNGFNHNSTFIDYYAKTGPRDIRENFTTYLWLADDFFKTPIVDSLQQKAFVEESGGMHNITGGAAFDIAPNVSIGFTLSGKWGNYNYFRQYEEYDDPAINKYNETVSDQTGFHNLDFYRLTLDEKISQTISGITGSLAMQARLLDFMRFGVTIKFPTFYEVEEANSFTPHSYFDNGDNFDTTYTSGNSYKVTTPFVYSAGFSIHALGATFSTGVEYTDVTQLEFSDAVSEVERLNSTIVQELVGQTTWGFGVEYELPVLPLVVRASYASTTSPYSQDIPGATVNVVSIGGGIYLAPNIRLDGLFRWSDLSQLRTNYGALNSFNLPYSDYKFSTSPLNIGLSLTYRY